MSAPGAGTNRRFLSGNLLYVALLAMASTVNASDRFPQVMISVRTDRPSAVYRCGEQAEFSVSISNAAPASGASARLELTLDGGKTIAEQSCVTNAAEFKISGSLDQPGFLRCTVRVTLQGQTHIALASAAFEPEKIEPTATMPADFDSFWTQSRRELERIPLDLQLKPLAQYASDKRDVFAFSMANVGGTRVYGFLSVPKKSGPFPAVVSIPPAGIGSPRAPDLTYADEALCMVVSVHDLELNPDPGAVEAYRKRFPQYYIFGAPDRDKYFYRRAILGADRAVSWLASRPDFDRRHMVVFGSSQGGGFSLIMAGLNTNITALAPSVPALSDHAGARAERSAGWPQMVKNMPSEDRDRVLEMSAYFDAVNFARRISPTVPAIVAVGFIDTTCCPSSVYSAYNSLRGPKCIFNGPLTGHASVPEFEKFKPGWIKGQLGLAEVLPPTAVPPHRGPLAEGGK